jgi:biotin transporter BioY
VAFLAGWIAERGTAGFARNLVAAVGAEVLLFAVGISWLAVITHSWRQAAFFGLYPFLFAEVSKVMLAAGTAVRLQRKF